MAKTKPKTMWVRPALIDVGPGRGQERARIKFPRDGRRELKPDGEQVPTKGAEGHFWKRRLAEGGVETFEPTTKAAAKTAAKPKTKTEAT